MNLDDKITNLQNSSMEQARAQGAALLDDYRTALIKLLEEHKKEAFKQSETRIKAESLHARYQLNQEITHSQLDLKKEEGVLTGELSDKIFEEVDGLLQEFIASPEYVTFLAESIKKAMEFSKGSQVKIFINPSDAHLQEKLEQQTGATLTISEEDFTGGLRAVIRERNILIDNSFITLRGNERETFVLGGGDRFVK